MELLLLCVNASAPFCEVTLCSHVVCKFEIYAQREKGCDFRYNQEVSSCFLLNDDPHSHLSSCAHYRKKGSHQSSLVQRMPQCSQTPFLPAVPAPLGPLPLSQLRNK